MSLTGASSVGITLDGIPDIVTALGASADGVSLGSASASFPPWQGGGGLFKRHP